MSIDASTDKVFLGSGRLLCGWETHYRRPDTEIYSAMIFQKVHGVGQLMIQITPEMIGNIC